ncbi:hypothetical protein [Halorhodospira halochloris]|uniref:hypothetical protein n=1 Tax=Halorhodospira halochloris TaxID=1052 RepID=UPI0013A53247|nr:hypothetical protein [Halorhodospira halochloris]
MEDAVNPSLEASWRHPWRQDLHTGCSQSLRGGFEAPLGHAHALLRRQRIHL